MKTESIWAWFLICASAIFSASAWWNHHRICAAFDSLDETTTKVIAERNELREENAALRQALGELTIRLAFPDAEHIRVGPVVEEIH